MVCCQKAAPRDCPRAAILAVHGFSMLLPPLSLCDSGPDDSPRLSIGMGFFRAETHPGLLHLRLRPATGAARGLTTGRRRAGPPYGVAAASRPGTSFPGVTNRARWVRVAAAVRPERQVSRLIEVRFPPQTGREKSPPRRPLPALQAIHTHSTADWRGTPTVALGRRAKPGGRLALPPGGQSQHPRVRGTGGLDFSRHHGESSVQW
jgi:hypothetical protein